MIRPKRAISKGPAGELIYRNEIALRPARLGTDADVPRGGHGKVIGIVNSKIEGLNHLTREAISEEFSLGAKKAKMSLQEFFDHVIQTEPHNLRLLLPGEKVTVKGIDIEALNEGDEHKLPRSRRATVLQGPITAGSVVASGENEQTVTITGPDKKELGAAGGDDRG